MIGANLKKRVT